MLAAQQQKSFVNGKRFRVLQFFSNSTSDKQCRLALRLRLPT